MLRHVRLFGVLVFILGFTGNASGQNFSNVVVFGDSLSDSGNAASLQPLPPGSSFTTNPDPVWSEIVAQDFGASGSNSLAGGPNYAFAGACMNPDTPCNAASPTVTMQIAKYFFKSGETADPSALYAIWGGLNDVVDPAARHDPQASTHTLAAADVNVAQIRRLQDAGARHILVFNLPDSTKSPYVVNLTAGFPEPVRETVLARLSGLGNAYNDRLYAGIRESEDGIVPINIHALFNEIVENHETYGFTDATGTACGEPDAPDPLSLACGPRDLGYSVPDKSGAKPAISVRGPEPPQRRDA